MAVKQPTWLSKICINDQKINDEKNGIVKGKNALFSNNLYHNTETPVINIFLDTNLKLSLVGVLPALIFFFYSVHFVYNTYGVLLNDYASTHSYKYNEQAYN